MMRKLQYAGPILGEEEVDAVARVMRSGWIGDGPVTEEFEKRFADLVGKKYCILTNSGSSANLLAFQGLVSLGRIEKGSFVAVPATAFPTSVNPVIQSGLRPMFLDCVFDKFVGPTYSALFDAHKRYDAMLVSHTLGGPEPTLPLNYNRCIIVEDCCDALGAMAGGEPIGKKATATTWSFYVSHHITMGEGGAVCTDDYDLAIEIRSLRSWGRACVCDHCPIARDPSMICSMSVSSGPMSGYSMRYTYRTVGYNLKATEMQAAIGLVQLDRLEAFLAARKRNYDIYYERFEKDPRIRIPPWRYGEYTASWMAVPFYLENGGRSEMISHLESKGIETRLLFSGCLPDHPAYKGVSYGVVEQLDGARDIMNNAFFVGNWPGLSEDDVNYICDMIEEGLDKREESGNE